MLSCKDITQLASENIDNNMPLFKRLQFNIHLMMCKNCRQFMDQMHTTIETISRIQPIQPDKDVIDNQVNQLMHIAKSLHKSN